MTPKLIDLFQKMYELTEPECRLTCRCPQSCCSPEYCEMACDTLAREGLFIKETGHPRLPYMSPTGCVVPPHFRPLCTLHTCDINGFGMHRSDPSWTKKYFELREQIEKEMSHDIVSR